MQIVAWYTPMTPKGAYMLPTTVGTYAAPAALHLRLMPYKRRSRPHRQRERRETKGETPARPGIAAWRSSVIHVPKRS
jgi:hypothetical protein